MGTDVVTVENCASFRLSCAVMDETLRLAPPVPIDAKFAAETHTLPSGVTIPKVISVFWRMVGRKMLMMNLRHSF